MGKTKGLWSALVFETPFRRPLETGMVITRIRLLLGKSTVRHGARLCDVLAELVFR